MLLRAKFVSYGEDCTVVYDNYNYDFEIVPVSNVRNSDLKVRAVNSGGDFRVRLVSRRPVSLCYAKGFDCEIMVLTRF